MKTLNWGEHFLMYIIIKALSCIPEANIICYVNFILIKNIFNKKEIKEKEKNIVGRVWRESDKTHFLLLKEKKT